MDSVVGAVELAVGVVQAVGPVAAPEVVSVGAVELAAAVVQAVVGVVEEKVIFHHMVPALCNTRLQGGQIHT